MGQTTAASALAHLEEDLTADWRDAHMRAHVLQFAGLFVGGMASALASAGWQVAGWGALGGLVLASAGGAVRQLWPQVPWPLVKEALAGAKAQAASPPDTVEKKAA